jgi:hypothetical protein
MRLFIGFLLSLTFLGTASATPLQFSQILNGMESRLQRALIEDFTDEQMTEFLSTVYGQAYNLDLRNLDLEDIQANADSYISRLFQIQITLQASLLNKWNDQGLLDNPDSLESYYAILRTIRYSIDMIGEAKLGFPRLTGDEEVSTAFENGPYSLVLGGDPDNLPPGTAYLVRGSAANSAAIARITDFSDGQFSHIGIMHEDNQGARYIVEALIEKGLVRNTYEYAMNHGVVRAQTFIFKDRELQRDAARIGNMFATSNIHYPYNFTMRLTPAGVAPEDFFCSGALHDFFMIASEGDVVLPMHPSRLPMNNFTMALGVEATETFAPSDIQSDSRFNPGPEWRDFRFTEKVRLQDLILDHMLNALHTGWYKFVPGAKFKIGASVAKFLSGFPGLNRLPLLKDIPDNMSRETLQHVLMLHFSTENLFKRVSQMNDDYLSEFGVPLSPKQINQRVDDLLRSEDAFGPLKKAQANPPILQEGLQCKELLR